MILVGPLFELECVRLSRRGAFHALRASLALVMLVTIAIEYPASGSDFSPKTQSLFALRMFETVAMAQLVVIWLVTPWFVCAVLTEEREGKTLEILQTTPLSNAHIVLGKLAARLAFVAGILAAGFPVLAIITLFGGIGFPQLALVTAGSLLSLFAIGCLAAGIASVCATYRTALSVTVFVLLLLACSPMGPRWLPVAVNNEADAGLIMVFVVFHNAMIASGIVVALSNVRPLITIAPPSPQATVFADTTAIRRGVTVDIDWFGPVDPLDGATRFTFLCVAVYAVVSLIVFAFIRDTPEFWSGGMLLLWVPPAMATCFCIATSIPRERESDTLLMLLTVPADRVEILRRKIGSAIRRTQFLWILPLVCGVLVSFGGGGPWNLQLWSVGLIMLSASLSLGAFLSVTIRTTFLAQLLSVCTMLIAGVAPLWAASTLGVAVRAVLPFYAMFAFFLSWRAWDAAKRSFREYRFS